MTKVRMIEDNTEPRQRRGPQKKKKVTNFEGKNLGNLWSDSSFQHEIKALSELNCCATIAANNFKCIDDGETEAQGNRSCCDISDQNQSSSVFQARSKRIGFIVQKQAERGRKK